MRLLGKILIFYGLAIGTLLLSALVLYALGTAFVHGGWVGLGVVVVLLSAFPAVVIGDKLRERR